jgi:hypothetical protein
VRLGRRLRNDEVVSNAGRTVTEASKVAVFYIYIIIVSEHMGWVRNVALMNVYFGSGKPQGVGISGREGARWADGGNARVSLRAT